MLEHIDLSQHLSKHDYEKQIPELQLKLLILQQKVREAGLPVVVMYEGWDAAGKGGSIVRITEKMDPRGYQVHPIGAPNEVERQQHYLWRFWTKLPPKGILAIFDRSWYGRVLVERVEKLCDKDDWKQAYREIRDFERTLIDGGYVLVKFWMHISKAEQLRRFEERRDNPLKRWKIGPDDWRNREKWEEYLEAAEEMFAETDIPQSPWRFIAAEDKHFARIETARIVVEAMEKAVR